MICSYIIYMEYTVYRLENIVTKKNYIGMTSLNPKKRWQGEYGGKMVDAINNYPFDLCWKKHIEFQTPNKEQALELESELMKWYDSIENGYNTSAYNSHHCKHSEETRRKISEAHTGEKSYWYGKHHSEESKKKIAESKFGNHYAPTKPVLQFSKSGEFIAEYPSTKEAERQTGCNQGHICACCKGKLKSTGGYIWGYKEGV